MLRFFTLLLIVLSLSACQDSSPSNSIRFGVANAPVNLDPRFATDATSSRINRLLYRALTNFDARLHPVPDLATWAQINATHYRFRLGESGRQFHDGSRLTAADVKATYTFILDPQQASPHQATLNMIQAIQTPDEETIDFLLTKPDPLFPGRLTIGILPEKYLHQAHPFNKAPIGSGPCRFIRWPQPGHLYLQRQRDQQSIEFLEVKDPIVRVLKLVQGEIDLLQNNLSPELIVWLTQRPGIRIQRTQGTNFTYLGFNLADAVTGQLLVRQAIAHAINRADIIQYILGQAASVAHSFLLPPTHWAGHAGLPGYTYQPQKAKALLKQAGFTEVTPVHLVYKTTSHNPLRIRIATVIQQQLADVGIHMDLKTYEWGTFYDDIKSGRFQLYSLSWVGIKMPDIFRYVFHSNAIPPQGANRGRFKHPDIDALIEQAEQAPTLEAQATLYQALQALLFKTLPYLPLWYEDQIAATNQRVTGYTLAPDGNYDGINTLKLIP